MNLSYFITKRINHSKADSFSSTIYKVAIASVGIGLAIMIISFLILKGFQDKIQEKMISFAGHFQITKLSLNQSFEEEPITNNFAFFRNYSETGFVKHLQQYAHKAALLKANDEVMGVVFKGISSDFDIERFNPNIVEGEFIHLKDSGYSKEIIISKQIANKLQLSVGDNTMIYFITEDDNNPLRRRVLKIVGIYETALEDFDEKILIGDLALIQRINKWPPNQVGGIEVYVDDFKKIDAYHKKLLDLIEYDQYVEKISDKYVEIFDWLALLNRNVVIFLSITLFVVSFNMISILIILIMERTNMIGTLKALGAQNDFIQKIFIYNGMMLIVKGLILGNIIGIGFGILQDRFKVIPLDPDNYYMDYVPITWNWQIIILLNILTFLIVSTVLILPTMVISRISPIKSIKFD